MNGEKEIRGIMRMLDSIAKTAEQTSLTGAFAEGKGIAIRQYNAILKRLSEMGKIPEGLFPELGEDASFDEVGIACKQLVNYLEGTMEAEERKERKMGVEGRDYAATGDIDDIFIVVGDMLRELGDWLRSGLLRDVKETLGEGGRGGKPDPR